MPAARHSREASSDCPQNHLLEVEGLTVQLRQKKRNAHVIQDLSFSLEAGRTLCIVGESGSGKSVTAMAVMRLLSSANFHISEGGIRLDGHDMVSASARRLRAVRGRVASIIFQDPLSTLNPVLTIGRQLREPLRLHLGMRTREAHACAIELLDLVGIPSAATTIDRYPHQLSGGQRQRVMIAMALACDPKLLIADEPTTALDVTTQAQILALLSRLQQQRSMALVLITHDLGVVAEMADEVIVMYAGRIAEKGPVADIFDRPAHPYTQGLLKSVPPLAGARNDRLAAIGGIVPGLFSMPDGCAFAPRCVHAEPRCNQVVPSRVRIAPGHFAACIRADEINALHS